MTLNFEGFIKDVRYRAFLADELPSYDHATLTSTTLQRQEKYCLRMANLLIQNGYHPKERAVTHLKEYTTPTTRLSD